MRVALVNPNWSFEGSIYFGCRDPHLPLELAYAADALARAGHESRVFDCHMLETPPYDLRRQLADFRPELTVLATAPTYLFWRCAPPELRVPQEIAAAVRAVCGTLAVVGPHGSATPETAMRKLGADVVVMGEAEDTLCRLVDGEDRIPGVARRHGETVTVNGGPQASRFVDAPPLRWAPDYLRRHAHHHHRFDREPRAPGAEVEASRGCPYHCTFCAKELFRDAYRRRELPLLLAEIDGLIEQGVEYLYFIDEIFLPNRPLLEALVQRPVSFGVQTRIDLWKPEMIALLGRAGCVSIEAGVESLTEEGRDQLAKNCRMSTAELTDRLLLAKEHIPFVQANLLQVDGDDADDVARWRAALLSHGVWANEPVPLFPYPGSPDYRLRWGEPDAAAWERAHAHYLETFAQFSDIQDEQPRSLDELEHSAMLQ